MAAGTSLRQLRTLLLDWAEVGDRGLAALAKSPGLPKLTGLGLNGNPITDRGARALLGWAGLRNLTMSKSDLISEGVRRQLQRRFGEHVCSF